MYELQTEYGLGATQSCSLCDQFLDSSYHRCPDPEPDIESALLNSLLVPLPRLQMLITNDLVCTQQHGLYSFVFPIKCRTNSELKVYLQLLQIE